MSQEEWVEKKREERPEEFAPPTYEELPVVHAVPFKRNKPNLFFTSKKTKISNPPEPNLESYDYDVWSSADASLGITDSGRVEASIGTPHSNTAKVAPVRRGAEIPPPQTMEYFGGSSLPKHIPSQKQDIADSISAGLEYLRKQIENKEKNSRKDMFDVM